MYMANSSIWNPALIQPGDSRLRSRNSIPEIMVKNPVMFVVEIGSVLTTIAFIPDLAQPRRQRSALQRPDHALALVHGAFRQLRRSDGRRPRQGPGREPAQSAHRNQGQASKADGKVETGRLLRSFEKGDVVVVEAGRVDSGRRHGDRRRGLGRRIGHHRRIGSRDPRVRAATAAP